MTSPIIFLPNFAYHDIQSENALPRRIQPVVLVRARSILPALNLDIQKLPVVLLRSREYPVQ